MKSTHKKVLKTPTIGDRLLTLYEAAEVLRLNPRTVRAYVRRGVIEGRIIGRRWRFRRTDLDAFFENASRYWDLKVSEGIEIRWFAKLQREAKDETTVVSTGIE